MEVPADERLPSPRGKHRRRRSYQTIGRELGRCTNPDHVHCKACGCAVIRLLGERRRTWCVRCIADGKAESELDLDDFMGAQSTWPWAGE
jgi:hypothetical protein